MRISDWSADVCSSDLNTIATTETGASLAWSDGATLTGGGSAAVSQVYLPDDMGVIDVAVINSYVIVIPVQEDGYQGRFYWIDPGEIVVDPLNFATAERSPDGIYGEIGRAACRERVCKDV